MHITDEVIKDYFYCKLKAYYKSTNTDISNKPFYYFEEDLKKQSNILFIKNNKIKKFDNINDCQSGYIYSIHTTLNINNHSPRYDYIEIMDDNLVTPMFVSGSLKANKAEKDFYTYKSKLLETSINKKIHSFKIILHDGKIQKIKFKDIQILDNIDIIDEKSTIKKSSHCNVCEYQSICNNKLKEDDDLRFVHTHPLGHPHA